MAEQTLPATDFQALPLDAIIAAPLIGAINAQKVAAETTRDFITHFLDPVKNNDGTTSYKPQTASFNLNIKSVGADGKETENNVALDAPVLSMVPVPHLRIDSITTHFRYEVRQFVGTKKEKAKEGEVSGGIKFLPFVDFSLKGNLSSRSSEESTTNRSGMLEITVHASEAPIPEGLARLLSLLGQMAQPRLSEK
jgi:hypothetical protein